MSYKCFILCAGKGKRMGDLTKDCPKPLLKVNNKPILQYQLEHLYDIGIKDIAINVSYQRHEFMDLIRFFNLKYYEEKELLGTAGAVKMAREFLRGDEPFLVIYGDLISLENHLETLTFHKEKNALATIKYYTKHINSELVLGKDNEILSFKESLKKEVKINSGMYCFSQEIFDYIPDGVLDFPKDIFPKLPSNRFYALPTRKYRIAINDKERLMQAERDLKNVTR